MADPPAASYTPQLRQQLAEGLHALGANYRPRTRHLKKDGQPVYTNRLILEDSPYLLQHAHNPVDWYSWGAEAFARAKRENKPVFLSVGYSTCHWCHVMEHESFEDEDVAEYLNRHFIAIKVDRERRPDIDGQYMTAVQMISGRGGWPMSSFLTVDGKTFFAGTYYPRDALLKLLKQANQLWQNDQPDLLAQAEKITAAVKKQLQTSGVSGKLADTAPSAAVAALLKRHDEMQGGFSPAPKFPSENNYLFLIDYARRHPDPALVELITFDLNAMAMGGMYDLVGGGFHRYSTDSGWLVPHFEKMLHNQALLASVYLQAAALTGAKDFERVAMQTLDYVLRDMRAGSGCFYSATDADSDGGEGRFFLWTPAEIRAALSPADADLAIKLFGVTGAGNFDGANILHMSAPLAAYTPPGQTHQQYLDHIDQIRHRLYQAREKRVHPHRDEKIVTAWNAMVIMSLAEAATLPNGRKYASAALACGQYIWDKQRNKQGQLWRASLDGRATVAATQEDYAWLADAYISLYDLAQQPRWLQRARQLLEQMDNLFRDDAGGGYFMNRPPAEGIPTMARPKDIYDSALPSGNAVALHALARAARRPFSSDELKHGRALVNQQRADLLAAAFAPEVNRSPSYYPYLLLGTQVQTRGQSGPHQYAAHGGVVVSGKINNGQLILAISIQKGWHINAHKPLTEKLIATTLSAEHEQAAWQLGLVKYPAASHKKLGFQEDKLALYEGDVRLTAQLKPASSHVGAGVKNDALLRVTLQLQACDKDICLPPEHLHLQIPVTPPQPIS